MKCTSCHEGNLDPAYLEGLFPCHTCSYCGGNLVMLSDYLRWQDHNKSVVLGVGSTLEIEAQETSKAMICPITGGIMTKYKISKDTEHRLDLSPAINAVWMDKGEWELLKDNDLAGRLNNIFTDHWQHDIRSQESADMLAALYERKFGNSYAVIKEFRNTLNAMESKSEVLAYLMAEDPYKP